MSDTRITRRVDARHHRSVTRSGVCPGCWDFTIVTRRRFILDEETGRPRYSGEYLCCGGPSEHRCWHMTKSPSAPRLYESFGPAARHPPACECGHDASQHGHSGCEALTGRWDHGHGERCGCAALRVTRDDRGDVPGDDEGVQAPAQRPGDRGSRDRARRDAAGD